MTGILPVTYSYDAWGNVLTATGDLANINPFRYRSYYYDAETYFYYLQSRYYDPAIGRFINADAFVSTGQGILGNNMFAYCNNNPVNLSDPNGNFAFGIILGKAVLGAAVNVLTTYIGAKVTGQSYSWKDAGFAALSGAFGTGGTVLKVAAGVVSGAYTGISAYQNGASVESAILCGTVSAVGTTVSVSNIAGWTGPELNPVIATSTDIVFGTAANSIAAATYRASTDTSTTDNKKPSLNTRYSTTFNRAKLASDRKLLI